MVSSGHGFRVCVKTSVFRQGTNLVVPLERGHRAVSTAEGTTSGAKAPHMPHVIGTVKTVPLHTPEEVLKRLLAEAEQGVFEGRRSRKRRELRIARQQRLRDAETFVFGHAAQLYGIGDGLALVMIV